jgi:tetratricopeptide (TPR) repeat protein
VLGSSCNALGRPDDALRHYRAELALSREAAAGAGDDVRRTELGRQSGILGNIANVLVDQGKLDEGEAHYLAALELSREVGNRGGEGLLMGNLGSVYRLRGRYDEAEQQYRGALEVHRGLGNRSSEGANLLRLGNLLGQRGRLEASLACMEEALEISTETGNRVLAASITGNMGVVLGKLGRYDEARVSLERALSEHRETGNMGPQGFVLAELGKLCATRGEPAAAVAHLESALELHRKTANRLEELSVSGNLARLSALRGQLATARDLYLEVIAGFDHLGARSEGERILLAAVYVELGRPDQARATLERVRQHLDDAPAPELEARCLVELARLDPADTTGALSYLDRAVSLSTGHPPEHALALVARARARLPRDPASAAADLDRAQVVGVAGIVGMELALARVELHLADGHRDQADAAIAQAAELGRLYCVAPQTRLGRALTRLSTGGAVAFGA